MTVETQFDETQEMTPDAPKKRRGRPRMTEEEKALARAKREAQRRLMLDKPATPEYSAKPETPVETVNFKAPAGYTLVETATYRMLQAQVNNLTQMLQNLNQNNTEPAPPKITLVVMHTFTMGETNTLCVQGQEIYWTPGVSVDINGSSLDNTNGFLTMLRYQHDPANKAFYFKPKTKADEILYEQAVKNHLPPVQSPQQIQYSSVEVKVTENPGLGAYTDQNHAERVKQHILTQGPHVMDGSFEDGNNRSGQRDSLNDFSVQTVKSSGVAKSTPIPGPSAGTQVIDASKPESLPNYGT